MFSLTFLDLPFTDMAHTLATEKEVKDESSWDSEVSPVLLLFFNDY